MTPAQNIGLRAGVRFGPPILGFVDMKSLVPDETLWNIDPGFDCPG